MDIPSLSSLQKLKASRPYQELMLHYAQERCQTLNQHDWPDVLGQVQAAGLQILLWEVSKALQGFLSDFSGEIQEVRLEWTPSGTVKVDFDSPKMTLRNRLDETKRLREFFEWTHFIEHLFPPTLKTEENQKLINHLFKRVTVSNVHQVIDEFVPSLNIMAERIWLTIQTNPSLTPAKSVRL